MASITFTPAELTALAKQIPTPDINALAKAVAAILGTSVVPPVVTPPVAGALWLFNAGKMYGGPPNDYSFGNQPYSVVYNNPAVGASGPVDVLAKGDVGWQPLWPGSHIDTTGFAFVTVSIKPTQVSGWISGMEAVGDIAVPGNTGPVNILQYGPNPPVVGQWNTYKIPLSAYGTTPFQAYKVMFLQQNTPNPGANQTEFDAVGLLKS
jgi:hypothetical protein